MVSRAAIGCAVLAAGWLTFAPVVRAQSPDRAALDHYLSANGLLNRGLYDLAAAEYEKFLAIAGEHENVPVACYGLGVCRFRTGKPADAIKALSPLTTAPDFPFSAEVDALLGQCHLALGETEDAIAALQRLLRKHPRSELADDASGLLIEGLVRTGRNAEAARLADSFERNWPASPVAERAALFGAVAQINLGEFAAARKRLHLMMERFPEGTLLPDATLRLAQCAQQTGDLETADRAYRRVLEFGDDAMKSAARIGLAGVLESRGDIEQAGKLLDGLIEVGDGSFAATAKLQRARLLVEQDQIEPAERLLRSVAAVEISLADDAAYWLAKCALRRGDDRAAAAQLSRALEQFADSPLRAEMAYDRALALTRAGELDAAVEAAAEFLSTWPDHAMTPDALYLAAVCEHRRERFAESSAWCAEFSRRSAKHGLAPQVAVLAADNAYLSNDLRTAAAAYRAFLERYATDSQARAVRLRMGLALLRLDQLDAAREALAPIAAHEGSDEAHTSALAALSEIELRAQRWKDAETWLRRCLATSPDERRAGDAALKLGLCLARQGRPADALDAMEPARRSTDDATRTHADFEAAQCLVALERFEEAAPILESLTRSDIEPRFAEPALRHLSAIAMRTGRYREADAYLARLAEQNSDEAIAAEAALQRGYASFAMGEYAAAERAFRQHIESGGGASPDVSVLGHHALAVARQDRCEEAVSQIVAIERQHADRLPAALRAALAFEKGACLRKAERLREAMGAFREAIEIGDAAVVQHARLELADLEFSAKNLDEAVRLLSEIRASQSELAAGLRAEAAYRLGLCELQRERFGPAAALLEEVVREYADSPLARSAAFFSAEALYRLGSHQAAVLSLERIVNGGEADRFLAPAMLRLGECHAAMQRWALSEEIFAKYLDRFPDEAEVYQAQFGIGWARENQQRYDEAIDAYRKVAAGDKGPTAARAQFQIGECFFAKKQYEDAVRELLKVDILFAYPDWSAAALYEAGRCLEELGKSVEAKAQYAAVLEKHEKTRWAELASQRLAKLRDGGLPGRSGSRGG